MVSSEVSEYNVLVSYDAVYSALVYSTILNGRYILMILLLMTAATSERMDISPPSVIK